MDEKDEKGSPGLYLPNRVIHQISGPVSMIYLKPKSSLALKGVRENLPLVLLWGDIHKDDREMCKDCNCPKDGKGCCFRIYDKAFLKELDVLASEFPVDFYTESSKDIHTVADMKDPKNVLFHHFLDQVTLPCHRKDLRSSPNYEKCPTENIRWHYSDIRYMKNTIEMYAFDMPAILMKYLKTHRSFLRFKNTVESELNDYSNSDATVKDESNDYDPILSELLHECIVTYQHFLFKIKNRTIPSPGSPLFPLYKEGLSLFVEIMDSIVTSGKLEDIFRVYVQYIMKKEGYSVIYKQIKKFSSILHSEDELVHFLTLVAQNTAPIILRALNPIQSNCRLHKKIKPILKSIFHYREQIVNTTKNSPIYKGLSLYDMNAILETLNLIPTLLFQIDVLFIELYSILRMLKPPIGSSSPFLVMGYFGVAHVTNFAKILQLAPYFDYEIVFKRGYTIGDNINNIPRNFRCLTIDTPIHLARDLEERARAILAHPEYQKSFQNYHMVLEAERTGRKPGSPPVKKSFKMNRSSLSNLLPTSNKTRKNNNRNKGNKENKGNKGNKGNKSNKSNKENKGNKGNKGNKENKGNKSNKGNKENKGNNHTKSHQSECLIMGA